MDENKLFDFDFKLPRSIHRLVVIGTVVAGSLTVFGIGFFFWFVVKLMAHFGVL